MTGRPSGDGSIHYLSTLEFDQEWLEYLRARSPRLVVAQYPVQRAEDIPAEVWARVDVLHTSTVLPDPACAPNLRWVQLDTSGVDHVVDHPLWRSPAVITTLGGVSPVPLAEYVILAVLAFAHRLPALVAGQRARRWPSVVGRWERYGPAPVAGATIAVVGYGRVGSEIGRQAAAHGMRVLAVSRTGRPPEPARTRRRYDPRAAVPHRPDTLVDPSRLHEILGAADYVVVVVPLTPSTRGMIDAAAFAAMKPGAVLVNVARGGIVDEGSLRDALRRGHVAGAALDVFDEEPLPADSPWWTEPGVLVTPHVSGLAADYAAHVRRLVTDNVERLLAGEPLLNQVDRKVGY